MRVKVAIGLVVALLATMLSVGPAAAGVSVVERNNGDVLINGDGAGNNVHVVFCDDGTVRVYIGDEGQVMSSQIIEIEDDLTINLKGGNDNLTIGRGRFFDDDGFGAAGEDECFLEPVSVGISGDHEEDPDIPGNLKILGASGNDDVNINNVSVGKDVTVSLSSGDNDLRMNYVHVGDDVTVRASGGRDTLRMYGFWIHDRLDANLSAGNNDFYFSHGTTARAIVRGHNGDDEIETGNGGNGEPVDFGHNPILIAGGGSDYVNLYNFLWTGKMRLNTGSGGDDVYLNLNSENGNNVAMADSILDLDTAAGDDDVHVNGVLIPGDDLNGGPGFDTLHYREGDDLGASIKNFEDEIDYDVGS